MLIFLKKICCRIIAYPAEGNSCLYKIIRKIYYRIDFMILCSAIIYINYTDVSKNIEI